MKKSLVIYSLLISMSVLHADWVPEPPPPTPVDMPYSGSSNCTIRKVAVQVPCGGTREVCHKDPWGTEICVEKENTCTEYVDVEECH
jgi:hypothetical protein